MNNLPISTRWCLLGATVLLASCAARAPAPDIDALAAQMLRDSFRSEGQAGVERLQQDAANEACSHAAGAPLPPAQAQALQAAALQTVRPPTDGRYLGDWREGEKLAQSGRGMTWSDASTAPSANGGSCYNCHQISPAELSFGTLGPSLAGYGRLRGVTDPRAPDAAPVLAITWAKLWNAKASNACSGMPRFGHLGLLDETQLKHLMALLLDPASPVNR
jgi:sulfur-oxidizing protein SoxX